MNDIEIKKLIDRRVCREFEKIRAEFEKRWQDFMHPFVDIHVLPGGAMPRRETEEAIGYDVRLRAVVSPFSMDRRNPNLRRTLCDFKKIIDPEITDKVGKLKAPEMKRARLAYRLDPGEMVLCGIGFVTAMPFSLDYLTLCRSGMSSRLNITVANGPGTIDPDYRGEAGVNLHNCGKQPRYLWHGMRIAQIKFDWAMIPRFRALAKYSDFSKTRRGNAGFGSTGYH